MSYLIYKVPFLDICPLYIQIHVQNAACTMIQLCWCSKNEPAVQTHWLTKNDDTESVCSAGDRVQSLRGKILRRREGNDSPLQDSCLESPIDGGAQRATVHGFTKVGHDWATNTSTMICTGAFLQQWWLETTHVFNRKLVKRFCYILVWDDKEVLK